MSGAWELVVARDDLTATKIIGRPDPELAPGEALLQVDRVGLTANNVTYALVGESMRYWDFFPTDPGWGRVPLWGYANVVGSKAARIERGTRVYGFLPTSSHLVIRPDATSRIGFNDASEHRAGLPRPYNIYVPTDRDPSYDRATEDLQVLYRPLFRTSVMLDDFLFDNAFFEAETILMSSASSKTAYTTAFCLGLRPQRPALVGLTSKGNAAFTAALGCYDEVLSYDDVTAVSPDRKTVYVDVAGNAELRRAIHGHVGANLTYDCVVGATHLEGIPGPDSDPGLAGPAPAFFFAPDQIRKRREDWGIAALEERFATAWHAFVPAAGDWVEIVTASGPEGLRAAWHEVLDGRSDPRTGRVVELATP